MQKLFFTTCFIFLIISKINADQLSDGYKSFVNNDIEKATQYFKEATQSENTKAEAYLMLSLLSTRDKENSVSFNYFLNFYKNYKNSQPYVMALFRHQSVLGYNVLKTEEQLNWLQDLLKRPDINSTLRAYAFETLARHYEAIHDNKKAEEYFMNIGAKLDWQIVGDFENISASGFEKEFGPLSHPEPDAIFKNKVNAQVKWFNIYKQLPGRWINFQNNFNCNNTSVFAQTFCNSPVDQVVFLRIGTSGSLKLWVNDQLIFKEAEERNNGLDTYIIPVKISKGNNRILLQIACSRISECNFMMRVTDKDGILVSNVGFSNVYSPYNKTIQEISAPIISLSEEFLLNQIKENPEKIVNYIVLANAYLSNDKTQEAMGILQKAQQLAPNCSFILDQLLELYNRDKNKTLASVVQEKLKQVDPENPYVLNYVINNAFDSENYKEARQLIEKKERLYGQNKDIFYYKLKLASIDNKSEEYSALIKQSYEKYPNDYNIVFDKYQFEKDTKQNPKNAIKVLKDFTKSNFNKDALKTLSDEYIQSGQVKEGVDILNKLIEHFPYNDDYYKQLGLYYSQTGKYNLAKQNFEVCIKIAPYYGPYHGYNAQVLEEMGEMEKAIEEYKLNVAYKPDDYEAINKLRILQSKKEVFDYFPQKDYYKIFENSPSATEYPSDNFLSLNEEQQIVLHQNGGCQIRQVLMYKAFTLKGIDNLKEFKIAYASNENLLIEKAEILKKNGNRLQAEIKDNHIVYTSLEIGDAVLLIYKKSKIISDQISKQFYQKGLLNIWYPSLNIEYNVLVDKNVKFDYRIDNSDIQPAITEQDEFKLYTWKNAFNNSIKVESYMPAIIDVAELLSLSTIPDWNFISKWYFDISNTKIKPDNVIIEKVKELMNGKENCSELQKAKIFYNFIEQNIRYSSVSFRQSGTVPQKASDVLNTRIGDCKDLAVLFTSFCNVVGIKAEIVLVLRRQNGKNWMNLPSFDFDHAIAKAILDGKEYYIELTSSYYPFAALGESLIGAIILNVNNDSLVNTQPKLLYPSTRQPNNLFRETKVTFSGDNMTNTISATRTGILAANSRAKYVDLGEEERNKKFNKSITGNYPNTKLLSLNFNKSLNNCSDTVTYNYSFSAPNVFTKINNLFIIKLPLTEKESAKDFLSIEDRKYPIETWKYEGCDTIIEKLSIVFPEKKTLVEVPKSVKYSCNQQDYSLTFTVTGNELKIVRTMIYKRDFVPVTEYQAYRSFMESVVNSDSQQIGFKNL